MDLNELKSEWLKPEETKLDEPILRKMVTGESHSRLSSVRRKMLIESVSLTIFLFLYYDAFDGILRPFYANLLLIISLLLYITGNVFNYFFIKNPVEGPNLKQSLKTRAKRLKSIAIFSLASSVIYATTLILFFTSSIIWTTEKYYIVAALVCVLLILFYFSFKTWQRKVGHFAQLVAQFDEMR